MKSILLNNLSLPIIAALSTIVAAFINQKQKILNNKKLIFFILITGIVLGVPGLFSKLQISFIPKGYILAQLVYLMAGLVNLYILISNYEKVLLERKGFVLLVNGSIMILGLYVFQVVFNYFYDIPYLGLVGGTSILPFLLPILFYWAYIAFISIPPEIYKVWYYPLQAPAIDFDGIDFDHMMVLEIEIYKGLMDKSRMRIKAKAPPNLKFGTWFQKFIDDYNIKYPNSGINYLNANREPFGMMFYVKPGLFRRKIFIDPELTIEQNKLLERYSIIVKRVVEQQMVTESFKSDKSFV